MTTIPKIGTFRLTLEEMATLALRLRFPAATDEEIREAAARCVFRQCWSNRGAPGYAQFFLRGVASAN